MFRKVLFTIFILLLMTGFVVAEDKSDIILEKGLPEITDKPTNISMLSVWRKDVAHQAEIDFINNIVKRYYPNVDVEIEMLNTNDLKNVVTTRIIAGVPPALAHVASGYNISKWATQGALVDMTKYWEKYNLEEIIPQGISQTFMFNGRYYGLPLSYTQINIFYWDKDILQEAGVRQPPYETWKEFFEIAKKFNEQEDIPFYADGLSPAWYAIERTLGLVPERYDMDIYERIINGKATAKDFKIALSFHKELLRYANEDYVSVNNTAGNIQIVVRGNAATAWQGAWGYTTFEKEGKILHKNYDYGQLRGYCVSLIITAGYLVFKGSGHEKVAEAIAVCSMLKESQILLNKSKGNPPARTDIELNVDDFSEMVVYSANYTSKVPTYPRITVALPDSVKSDYTPIITGYLAGSASLEETIEKLLKIQEKYQDKFSMTWNL